MATKYKTLLLAFGLGIFIGIIGLSNSPMFANAQECIILNITQELSCFMELFSPDVKQLCGDNVTSAIVCPSLIKNTTSQADPNFKYIRQMQHIAYDCILVSPSDPDWDSNSNYSDKFVPKCKQLMPYAKALCNVHKFECVRSIDDFIKYYGLDAQVGQEEVNEYRRQ